MDLNPSDTAAELAKTLVAAKPRVCAVSYLNTLPLVWGMVHGPLQSACELQFRLPAECADDLAAGRADVGLIPVAELLRLPLDIVPGLGIACHGAVRSILLVSKCPPSQIKTLAADSSSRTSVQLVRIILNERYGAHPEIHRHAPELEGMLSQSDAALIIGDPALRIDPLRSDYHVLDLGEEWFGLTGLPMVFAVWAGQPWLNVESLQPLFLESYMYGKSRISEIALAAAAVRGISVELAEIYLRKHIVFELGPAENEGLRLFLQYAGRVIRGGKE